MSSGVDLYIPEVIRAQVGALDFRDQVNSVSVRMAMNMAGGLDIAVQPPVTGSQVRVIEAAESLGFYTGLAAGAQQYAFSRAALTPDTMVSLEAGRGAVHFRGYFSASAPTMGVSEAQYVLSASGSEAALGLIDLTAYRVVSDRADSYWDEAVKGEISSWKQLMTQTLKALTSEARSTLNDDAFSKVELQRSLERNSVALPALFRIINQAETPFMDAMFAASAAAGSSYPDLRSIATWIGQTAISTGQGGVWGWLMNQAQAWGLQYVPMAGGVGRLVEISALLDQDPISLEVEAQQLDASMVMSDILPVTRVLTTYPTPIKKEDGRNGLQMLQNVVGAWPEEGLDVAGSVQQIPPPPWMTAIHSAPMSIQAEDGFNFEVLQSWDSELVSASGLGADRLSQILSWWSRTAYRWQSLALSGAHITGIPLDGRFEVGQMLRVTAGGGVPILGLVESVNHSLASSDRGGVAGTSLSLTHCRFGDFIPPGW